MSDNIKRCPKCGYPDVYIGATSIECGYDETCDYWTQKQADEVERLLKLRFPEASKYAEPEQFELDWEPDEEITAPMSPWPLPDFGD